MSDQAQTAAPCLKPQSPFDVQSLLEQGSGTFNEDALLIQETLFGVFDGASSLKGDLYRGKSGAWWAAHLARGAFAANDASLSALAEKANRAIAKGMVLAAVDVTERLQLWSTSAAVVRINGEMLDYVQIGDALILAIYDDGIFDMPAPFHNHDRSTFDLWGTLAQQGCDNIRTHLVPHIEQVRRQMNRQFGVLNGEEEMRGFLHSGSLPTAGLQHLLIFTDGLHLPKELSGNVDFARMVDCYLQHGLTGLHQAIRHLEKSDPDCCRFPRFKQHDDIATIAIEFNH
ncbi:MAG: protein phosphatase 2C domain-containing protein [Deltaproteobacteria bacterium]|nr:protein phosphatase 2C domain-containing protein [Deltaproteobacteria bacterium]